MREKTFFTFSFPVTLTLNLLPYLLLPSAKFPLNQKFM